MENLAERKLPEGKILIPGVVTQHTNVVEHPEVVADRIVRIRRLVGRENVIAGTDCGMGFRVHPQIAWAKLKALAEGAAWPANNCGAKNRDRTLILRRLGRSGLGERRAAVNECHVPAFSGAGPEIEMSNQSR